VNMLFKERIAIVDGVRTPLAKVGTSLKKVTASELGRIAVQGLLKKTEIDPKLIEELIFGNVAQPADSANIARVIALKAGLDIKTPAYTVHRNCASGMEAISSAAVKIAAGEGQIYIAGGTENMTQIPLLFNAAMTRFFENLFKAKTPIQKLKVLFSFRLSHLKPVIGVEQGLTDPVCGLIMGLTAENIAKEFHVTREEQDEYALESHRRASAAAKKGIFLEETVPVILPPDYKQVLTADVGPRDNQTIEALAKLKPYFDRNNGTVTVGNACPLTDGAGAVLLMSESKAKAMGYQPLGYLKAFAYAGLDPAVMGLGPVFATQKLFKETGLGIKDIERVEINEAFAAQVIGCERAMNSKEFCEKHFQSGPIGSFDRSITNVNGGAIALGHPVGMTGTRLVITLLKELKRANKKRGLATLCIGGGQGGARRAG
jgi:acetyl-CoA C-acetyltransferase/acetyl-CoA acyltransferase